MRQRRTFLMLSGAFSLFLFKTAWAAAGAGSEPPKLRLPGTARPIGYAVDLAIDPSKETFRGSVDIAIRLGEETDLLWLHGADLTIEKATASAGGRSVGVKAVPAGGEFLGFAFERPVGPGELALHVEYTGRIDETSTQGLFRQKDGGDWYVFSQLEATDARRAFPCFDEPSYKVPWQLTLRIPKGTSAVSNTPIASEKPAPDGTRVVRFEKTDPLPAYLVALAVGPFDYVDAGKAGAKKTPIRIVTPRGKASQARYAAATTGELLENLEAYFGIPYPYEKLDQLAIPQTVTFLAMENAGLITWGERALLAPPAEETVGFQRLQASVNAHEIAHQWFGDLVTLAWWDDVWLNESFATWMADRTMIEWKPEWNEDVARVVASSKVMGEDKLVTARKIRQEIRSNDDIVNAFDGISYQKGAAVLTMFESWLGPEKFRTGVRQYLKAHRNGIATSRDFLAAVESASRPGAAAAFSTFLEQAGVPVLEVSLDCAGGGAKLALSQKRLLPLGTSGSAAQVWQAPVCLRSGAEGKSGRECVLLTRPGAEVSPPTSGCPAWVVANDGATGYYRTLYRGDLLPRLLAVADTELTVAERVSLIRDVNALAETGKIPMNEALALVPRFAGDPSRRVVEATLDLSTHIRGDLVPPEMSGNYARFLSKTYGARARDLGFSANPGEDDDTHLLRKALVPFVATYGEEPGLQAEARRLSLRWLEDSSAIDAELGGAVLGVAAHHGGRTLFDRYRAAVKSKPDRRDRVRLYGALGDFRDPALLKEAFALTLAPGADFRESSAILVAAAGDPGARPLVWDFLKANFDTVVAKTPREATGALPYYAAGFCDAARRKDIEAFFAGRIEKLPGGPRNLAQALESVNLCIAARAAQEPGVGAFLEAY